MERCLACEAVTSSGHRYLLALPRAALYHIEIDGNQSSRSACLPKVQVFSDTT